MKKERIITLAASLMLLTACSEYIGEDTPDGRIPVNLGYTTLTAEETTRTAAATDINDANIATGDKITVQIKNNGAAASTYTGYTYTAAAAGAMTPPSSKPYYPTGSTNIDILAYYPYNAAANFDVAADQTSDANYKASDLMVATKTNQAKTTETVALAFQHQMAKLVVTATAGDGVSEINTITLKQVKRRVSFTNTTGAVGTATSISGTDVTLFKEGTANTGTGAALIPGQTITGDLIEIATDQGTATYSVPSGKTFNANTKYTINITVNRTAVGSTVSISNWGEGGSATITAGGGDFTMGSIDTQTYNDGTALTPEPTVSYGGNELTKDTHYTLQYVNNTNAGTAAVYAIGKGTYVGKVGVKEFTINKADCTVDLSTTSLTIDPNGTGTFTVTLPATCNGSITATSNNTSKATTSVSQSGNTATVTVTHVAAGSATITVTVGESTNYNAYTATNKTVSVTCTDDPGIPLSSATSSHVGKVIGANGKIYDNVTAATSAGSTTAVAMIAYVGDLNNENGDGAYSSTYNHGLAIALADVINTSGDPQTSTSSTSMFWTSAGTACSAYKGSRPSASSDWFLPSAYQWERMLKACGSSAGYVAYSSQSFPTGTNGFGYGNFRTKLKACGSNAQGVYDVQSADYWSSTVRSSDTDQAWAYNFNYSRFNYYAKASSSRVRAVFAF